MGKLTKRISPIKWLSAPSLNFQQGQSGQIKVRDYVHDPQRLLPAITLNGTLPSGCSFNGEDVSYDGVGAAGSASVTFTATTGTWSQTSSSTTCAIQANQQNNPPVWATIPPQSVTEGYVGPVLDLANYCTDPDGDPITYGASGLPTGLSLQGSMVQADGTQVATPATTIAVTADDGQTNAEADWIARSTAPGVVWAHDFRYEAEVDAFRQPVNPGEPDTLSWVSNSGIGSSGAIQVTIPKGLSDGTHYIGYDSASGWIVADGTALPQPSVGQSNADWTWKTADEMRLAGQVSTGTWLRPFAAISKLDGTSTAGNGLPNDDPAAGGAVPIRDWTTTARAASQRFLAGYYAHPDYAETCRTWPDFSSQPQTDAYDGSDYWIQCRVKLSYWRGGERGLAATNEAKTYQYERYSSGKLFFIGTTGTTPLQEIVPRSQPIEPRQEITGSRFTAYTAQGSALDLFKRRTIEGQTVDVLQPGGDYESSELASTCYFNGVYAVRDCWYWSYDEWITLLFHVIPGRQQTILDANPANADNFDTGFEVWAARPGETSYTKIVGVGHAEIQNSQAFPFYFDTGGMHPNAWNALLCTGYMNNAPSLQESSHSYTQIIFKRGSGSPANGINYDPEVDGIPCPQA